MPLNQTTKQKIQSIRYEMNLELTLVLNEKSPEVTSVIEVDRPFFPVDSIVLDLLMDEGGVLFVFISFIDDCNCC
jgi:hypothetical protein